MQDLKKDTGKAGGQASSLTKGRERFLAHVIEHGFEVGRRSSEDFVRHFPPTLIMEGLKDQPALRAKIVVEATGLKEKVALKKTWQSCADDLQIALDESETDATAIMAVFPLDDRVRYLDQKALWAYVTEGEFWKISPSRQKEYSAAKGHMAFMLARALEDKLITHADIVDGITVEELASRLPKSELGKIIKGALDCGKRNTPFTETDLLGSMPPDVLVNYMPLFQVWDSIIDAKIAAEHGYVAKKSDALKADAPKSDVSKADAIKADAPKSDALKADAPKSDVKSDALKVDPANGGKVATPGDAAPSSVTGGALSDKLEPEPASSSAKLRGKTPPPPLPPNMGGPSGSASEDPSTWSQEFDEDTDFVDATDLIDDEPTINKGRSGGKESTA